jgi:hypothetical protein
MMAVVGAMEKETGNNNAKAVVADKPGIAPNITPITSPIIEISKLSGANKILKTETNMLIFSFYSCSNLPAGSMTDIKRTNTK